MEDLGYLALVSLGDAPMLLVLLVGLALTVAARDRLTGRPRRLLVGGLCVLLAAALLGLGTRLLVIPWGRSGDFLVGDLQLVLTTLGLIQVLAYPAGLGLVIAAALSGRRATDTV